ncbi:MAG: hypothetical protein HYR95_00130, partial [Candidatus Colwellbacteria bacterium]|nr:hypothetical protein [Candidatus Colwellbacteria bacterium]
MKLIKIDSQEWYAQLELVKSKLDRFRRIDFMDFFAVKAIYGIRCDLERLGVTLEYIGTDEGELERLRINGCRFRAKNAL